LNFAGEGPKAILAHFWDLPTHLAFWHQIVLHIVALNCLLLSPEDQKENIMIQICFNKLATANFQCNGLANPLVI
jgi:hypothetical protein